MSDELFRAAKLGGTVARLAYADHLEETGEVEIAMMIREAYSEIPDSHWEDGDEAQWAERMRHWLDCRRKAKGLFGDPARKWSRR